MRVFISGGVKNGKSYYAQRLAKKQEARPLYYIATMKPADGEDYERIARHKLEREGWGFITIEQDRKIAEILDKCDTGGSFLLDSLTALLANEMFRQDGSVDTGAAERVEKELTRVIGSIANIVIVSDYIYSDANVFDPFTEKYRESLAKLDRAAAISCDTVLEVTFSNVIVHKNEFGMRNSEFGIIDGGEVC